MRAFALAPHTLHDLRGDGETCAGVGELRYPARAALVIAGIPGAGKSTALHTFFGTPPDADAPARAAQGALVVDSHQSRVRLRRRLAWLPYPLWRPVMHAAHYTAVRAALRGAGPVVIHDCGTYRWSRRMIARWTAAAGRELHVVMLDVAPEVARAGQRARGRRINPVTFALHCRRWRGLVADAVRDTAAPGRTTSAVLTDRAGLNRLQRIVFED
ncbi:AAA family ATPase [Nocardia sp. NPDC057353]|uniref:AAA family ATPase n=1 Tax=Nocardia sp. NPDC057353 TaxID=3346104 RepID=UPI00364156A7